MKNLVTISLGVIIGIIGATYFSINYLSENFIKIVSAEKYSCVLSKKGTLSCFENTGKKPVLLFVAADVKDVFLDNREARLFSLKNICSLKADNTVACLTKTKSKNEYIETPEVDGYSSFERWGCVYLDQKYSCNESRSFIDDALELHKNDVEYCALKTDRTVWCALAYNTSTYQQPEENFEFKQVAGLSDIQTLVRGRWHFCATNSDQRAFCWGANQYGQFGTDGTRLAVNTEVALPFVGKVTHLATQQSNTCVVKDGVDVYCWGYNGNRQIFAKTAKLPKAVIWTSNGDGTRNADLNQMVNAMGGKNKMPVRMEIDVSATKDISITNSQICVLKQLYIQCFRKSEEYKITGSSAVVVAISQMVNSNYVKLMNMVVEKSDWPSLEKRSVYDFADVSDASYPEVIPPTNCKAATLISLKEDRHRPTTRCVAKFGMGIPNGGGVRETKNCSNPYHCGRREYLDENNNIIRTKEDTCSIYAQCVAGNWKVIN